MAVKGKEEHESRSMNQAIFLLVFCLTVFPPCSRRQRNENMSVPVADLKTDAQGRGNVLAFTKFFDTFDRVIIRPKQ